MITSPRRLDRADSRSEFRSGVDDLDEWLRKYARQSQSANTATTYVITDDGRVIGYYAIAMASVELIATPQQLRRSMPRQVPCILLARLAVDQKYQGRGIGAALLRNALLRAVQLSHSIGAAAVLIHCRDEEARAFYLNNGDFLPSPVNDLQLMIPIKGLAALLKLTGDG